MECLNFCKDDFNSPIHPDMWDELLNQFNLPSDTEMLTIWGNKAEGDEN